MEKFSQFGVEPLLMLAQIINFLILLYLLKRFLYKPILDMLKKREEKIKEGLTAAAKGEELLIGAREEEKVIVGKAQEEANLLIEETKTSASKIEEELLERAKNESEQMIKRAKGQIEQEKIAAERQLEGKIARTAVDILEGILPKFLSREDQVRILEGSQKMFKKALPS